MALIRIFFEKPLNFRKPVQLVCGGEVNSAHVENDRGTLHEMRTVEVRNGCRS
jgi:hypothetical protein